MRCLSVCQPFAELIVSGRKKIELRGWNTRFRGEFLVHAPQKIRYEDARRLKAGGSFVTGAIVGRAELVEVKAYKTASEWRGDAGLHLASGRFLGSRYGFVLKNPKKFNTPIPQKGRLGFFEAILPGAGATHSGIISEIIEDEHRYRLVGHH